MTANRMFAQIAMQLNFGLRRTAGVALMGVALVLSAATARAQDTQVTIEGTITSVTSLPGVIVGDKYSMVVYYNATQAPASTCGTGCAYYTGFTLNAVVDDKDGNQNFSAESGEELAVEDASGNNEFLSPPCCSSSTGAAFVLEDTTGTAFKTDALPTALTLKDFGTAIAVFGNSDGGSYAEGNITSIRVLDTGGVIPAFITAGAPDPDGKVPTVNGVSGSGVTNLDVSFPLTLLSHGSSYVFTIAFQNINFTGTCQASYKLTQIQYNKTVTLDSGTGSSITSCNPGTYWYWTWDSKAIPDYPGPAMLTGTVTYGSSKVTTTTTVVFQ
jgi:hypothetical protein